MQAESIYNLIPPAEEVKQKEAMHRSKYPGSIPPTASSFGRALKTTVPVSNLAGEYELDDKRDMGATWGPRDGVKKSPKQFTKVREKHNDLPEATRFEYRGEKKPAVPKADEAVREYTQTVNARPSKNFLVENAVKIVMNEGLGSKTLKTKAQQDKDYLKKPDFGTVPSYLDEIKEAIHAEKEQIRRLMDSEKEEEAKRQSQMRALSEDEKQELLSALKKKWETVNAQYQGMTHMTALDTLTKIRRKEEYESNLAELEKSMEKLNKKVVFVKDE